MEIIHISEAISKNTGPILDLFVLISNLNFYTLKLYIQSGMHPKIPLFTEKFNEKSHETRKWLLGNGKVELLSFLTWLYLYQRIWNGTDFLDFLWLSWFKSNSKSITCQLCLADEVTDHSAFWHNTLVSLQVLPTFDVTTVGTINTDINMFLVVSYSLNLWVIYYYFNHERIFMSF